MTPAEPVRLALIASSDEGSAGDGPLEWADRDAVRVADTLTEVGGFAPGDVWLVPGATVDAVTRALGELVVRAAGVRAEGGAVELWVYYTGHAAADGLHLGGETLPLGELKAAARVVPADARVFVVDACQSGLMLRTKGATLVAVSDAPTDVTPPPDEAWMTSAGAEQSAFEVDGRRGALFTHFFVSGARGAADDDHDGDVTLGELYGFVHARTAAAAAGLGVAQEPRWAGALGEVVVSRTTDATGVWATGPVAGPLLLVDERRGDVVAEIPAGAGVRIAAPAGPYQLVEVGGGPRLDVGRVVVPAEGWVEVAPAALRTVRGVRARGGLVDLRSGGLAAGASVGTGRAPGAPLAPGAFVEWRRALGRGVDGSVGALAAAAPVRGDTFAGRSATGGAQLGARWDLARGPVRVGPAVDVAAGATRQVVARAPDPVWGRWYGGDDERRAAVAGWVAAHAGVGLDLPAGPVAVVTTWGAGPATFGDGVVVDVTARAGLEWRLP